MPGSLSAETGVTGAGHSRRWFIGLRTAVAVASALAGGSVVALVTLAGFVLACLLSAAQ